MVTNTFKQTEIGEVPEDWGVVPYSEATIKVWVDFEKLKTKQYEQSGKYPIIDQGAELIAGYTNDQVNIYRGNLPVIIFGDHTLIVKFIDFPFAVGADGTKIINANTNKYIPKFFYYAILLKNIQSEGYKRHFSKLREQLFVCPSIPEQKQIASILSCVDLTISETDEIIGKSRALKKGLMQELLTRGIGHTKFKQTEIGEVPEEWGVASIRDVCIKTKFAKPEELDEFKYIDVSAVSNERFAVTQTEVFNGKTAPGRARKKVNEGDVIFATVRPVLNRVALITNDFDGQICSTAFCVIRADPGKANNLFLFFLIQSENFNSRIVTHQVGATYPAVSDKIVLNEIIPVPPKSEQERIASILWAIHRKIESELEKRAQLELLKKGLMQDLLTGRVRFSEFIKT